jgi:hypothetical protein
MAAYNLATILPALLQMTNDVLLPQFEQEPAGYNMFVKDTKARFVNGKGFRLPNYLFPATGVGAISEGGSFKQPGVEFFADMYVGVANMSMAYEITGSALKNIASPESLIRSFNNLLQMRTTSMMKEANYQVYDDGSALRAIYVASGSTGTVLNLSNSTSNTPTSGFGSTKGGVHINPGESYDVYSSDYSTYRGTVIPTAKTNTTMTIPAAVAGISDGDKFILSGSLYKAPRGLPYLINNDTGVFQLLSRATYPQLRSPVIDLNGAAITVADFVKTKNLLVGRAGVGKAKKVVAVISLAQDDALRRLGQNFKRFDGDAKTFDGSFENFRSGDTVTFLDPDCDEDRIYMVCPDEINKYEQRPFGLYDMDGLTMRMRSGVSGVGSDAYTGALGAWYNLGTKEPRTHALIKRCSVSGLATQVLANA